jgi:hypothetical protein|tara:strand:- start:1 stop:666 length:666 start_codon:yes stop_codon:yes gene_type:complete
MNFKKLKYTVIKKAISKDLAIYLYNYFLMKKQVYDTCIQYRYLSPFETINGFYEGKDDQIPDTFAIYSDAAMDTLMLKCQPIMEKTTGLKLQPSYTYARIYKKGDILKRHKDRFSCEISTTLNLGGDDWPIYLSPNENVGIPDWKKITTVSKAKGVKINLNPGDMLVYRGMELEHWREKFKGKNCAQVFLHYNNLKTRGSRFNIFDKKKHLGLPAWFKEKK